MRNHHGLAIIRSLAVAAICTCVIGCGAPELHTLVATNFTNAQYTAIELAVAAWNKVPGVEIVLYRYAVDGDSLPHSVLDDAWVITMVIPLEADEHYVATTYPDQMSIELNATMEWYDNTGFCDGAKYDIQTTVMHELGHALGYQHSMNNQDAMYPRLAPCERRRQLPDEMNGDGN